MKKSFIAAAALMMASTGLAETSTTASDDASNASESVQTLDRIDLQPRAQFVCYARNQRGAWFTGYGTNRAMARQAAFQRCWQASWGRNQCYIQSCRLIQGGGGWDPWPGPGPGPRPWPGPGPRPWPGHGNDNPWYP